MKPLDTFGDYYHDHIDELESIDNNADRIVVHFNRVKRSLISKMKRISPDESGEDNYGFGLWLARTYNSNRLTWHKSRPLGGKIQVGSVIGTLDGDTYTCDLQELRPYWPEKYFETIAYVECEIVRYRVDFRYEMRIREVLEQCAVQLSAIEAMQSAEVESIEKSFDFDWVPS